MNPPNQQLLEVFLIAVVLAWIGLFYIISRRDE